MDISVVAQEEAFLTSANEQDARIRYHLNEETKEIQKALRTIINDKEGRKLVNLKTLKDTKR